MREYLEQFNLEETEEQRRHREAVLNQLYNLLETWIRSEYKLLGRGELDGDGDEDENEQATKGQRVHLCTFGSYRL